MKATGACNNCLQSQLDSESWNFSKLPYGLEAKNWPYMWNHSTAVPRYISYNAFIAIKAFATLCGIFIFAYSFGNYFVKGWPIYMWFIYLTHWQVLVLMVYLISSFCITVAYRGILEARSALPWWGKMTWCLQNICVGVVPCVVIDYWTLVYDGGSIEFGEVLQHGFTLIVLLIDLSVSLTPTYIKHVYQPLLFAISYLIFNCIYVMAGGVNEDGDNWIYSVMDWTNDFKSAFVISFACSMFLAPVVYTIVAIVNEGWDNCLFHEEEKIDVVPVHPKELFVDKEADEDLKNIWSASPHGQNSEMSAHE